MNFGMIILNQNRAKLSYMDTDSFIVHIIVEDFHDDIATNCSENKTGKRPLIGLLKDELGGKIMEELCALRAKTYAYLINGYNDDDYDKEKIRDKKAKGAKKCVIKRRLIFENYKDCLFNDTVILRSQLKFKSNYHEMYTEEINKIALSSNDYKRLQTFDRFIKQPCGTNTFKVWESEMVMVKDLFFEKLQQQ